ncbi:MULTISPECIES: gliding motility protein GldL [unclassified Siphonobacter]|uniref:type IX secretion system motor protein PorL/GldL n=1 Tax=unclassified Siphonobacter TaxID=2635712 RepID=UPI000CB7CFA0|nr:MULTISPECIES: gliding motility protein GldL [unclassified Siphonobacter]MDR6193544.1 gliding motility-associated protein GldL [Siphonobacter sp. SORGH_AS_0500]PKK36405.1 gliding motility protein GldL [Siphonobacter sp. SORGH_AS_0500]
MAAKRSVFFDKILPVIYSVGAAVVILGALFKIQHREGADTMLTIGMGTEAVIFFLFAFQQFVAPDNSYQWEKVYPELDDNYKGELPTRSAAAPVAVSPNLGLMSKMDDMLANAKVTPDVFNNLGTGLRSLTDTVGKIGQLTDATVATNEYAKNVKIAAGSLQEMNKSYGTAVTAMSDMASATMDAKEYRVKFQQITQTMGALNAVYELELQDTQKHLKAMNAFYGNLASAMDNMQEASKDAQQFKNEMGRLTNNLQSLNNIYGGMLSAMKGVQ